MEKQRAALLAKAKKPSIAGINKPTLSKISTAGTRPGTSSAGNTPTEVPKKVGYKELLARAAQAQAEKKSAPGTITHKARPQIKEQKAWQRKLEEQKAVKAGGGANGVERSSKSPGVASGGEKGSAIGKKSAEPAKAIAGKKGVGGAAVGGADGRRLSLGIIGTTIKGRAPEKTSRSGSAVDIGTKRKRDVPLGHFGGSGKSGGNYSLPRKNSSRRHDTYEEDEDDGFVVDDDDDAPAKSRSYGSGAGGKKYVSFVTIFTSLPISMLFLLTRVIIIDIHTTNLTTIQAATWKLRVSTY